jgi:hypothetical protein
MQSDNSVNINTQQTRQAEQPGGVGREQVLPMLQILLQGKKGADSAAVPAGSSTKIQERMLL